MNQELNKIFGGFGEEFIDEANAYSLQVMFVNAIKTRMKDLSITQKSLADKLNIHPSYLSGVFNGNKLLNLKHIAKIERILGFKVNINFDTIEKEEKSLPYNDFYYSDTDNSANYCHPNRHEIEQTIRRLSDSRKNNKKQLVA